MQIENEQKLFDLTKVLENQERIKTFVFEGVSIQHLPLMPQHEAMALELDREDFIKYVTNWSLVSHGVRHTETGEEDKSLATFWKSEKIPTGFREALADEVAEPSGLDVPEKEDEVTEESLAADTAIATNQ